MIAAFILLTLCGFSSAWNPLYRTQIASPKSSSADYLLPNNLTASLYQVVLETNFETDSFNGSVDVSFTSWITTDRIVIHIEEINITASSINLLDSNGNVINSVACTSYSNDDRHFYTIVFAESLVAGVLYKVSIGAFTGHLLHDDHHGYYLGRSIDAQGNVRKIATTQFQPTMARRAFPCFDEPALKAQFDISMIRTADYHSLANTPLVSTREISPGRFLDVFERTVVMSTYLIAFVVSDYTYVEKDIHRVYGRSQYIARSRGSYALNIGIDIFDGIQEFVEIPYSLPKLDQIAIPDDYFAAGAMENWGLVTYREEFLLYEANVTNSDTQEFIAIIIAHEFGHQWFGNLVSPTWWSYLWLNEGFATYFEYFGGAMAGDDLELFDQMVVQSVQRALSRDSSATTRYMNMDAGSPADVDALFDIVAYDKAGAVILMVEGFLTSSIFRNGLLIFLRKREYAAADPKDLYDSWQEAVDESNLALLPGNETMETILSTWANNAGYPLITITVQGNSVQISQLFHVGESITTNEIAEIFNRACGRVTTPEKAVKGFQETGIFPLNPNLFTVEDFAGAAAFTPAEPADRRFIDSNPNNSDESLWYVPISLATTSNQNLNNTLPNIWLRSRSLTTTVPELGINDWLIANVRQTGYFRVNYDFENWNRIISALVNTNIELIHRTTRAQLVDDSYTLARYGVISYDIPLRLTSYFVRETDYIAMYPFFEALSFLEPHVANSLSYYNFQNYVQQILRYSYDYVGLRETDQDRHLVKKNRERITTWTCRYRDTSCLEFARERLTQWRLSEAYIIVPNQQTILTCAALRNGNQYDFDFVLSRYGREELVVRRRLLRALGCIENTGILNEFVNIIVNNGSQILSRDRLSAFASIYNAGNLGLNFVFNYVRQNYALISSRFTAAQVSSLFNGLASRLTTQAQLNQLQQFADSVGEGESTLRNALATAQSNVNWSNQYLPSIISWLSEQGY